MESDGTPCLRACGEGCATSLYFRKNLIYVECGEEKHLAVQMYFVESRTRRNRPVFVLDSYHEWFEAFKSEFDMLWYNSKPWNKDVE